MYDLIKPIETKHNGYHFRSRLEARWAVFFEELGIEYLYEHEGYDLTEANKNPAWFIDGEPRLKPEETWYLPDFYLPDYKWYFEIKPGLKAMTSSDLGKISLLGTEHRISLINGSPWRDGYCVLAIFNLSDIIVAEFAEGHKCDRLWLVVATGPRVGQSRGLACDKCWSPKCEGSQTWAHRGLEKAYEAAKGARFYYGARSR